MKNLKPFIVVMAVFLAFASKGQEMPRHVFSAGGGHHQSGALHLCWTIGQAEPLETSYQPNVILSSGFQQEDDIEVSLWEGEVETDLLLYPNPCQNNCHFRIATGSEISDLRWQLYDFSGKLVLEKSLPGTYMEVDQNLELGHHPPGVYNLRLFYRSGAEEQLKSIKIIRN